MLKLLHLLQFVYYEMTLKEENGKETRNIFIFPNDRYKFNMIASFLEIEMMI